MRSESAIQARTVSYSFDGPDVLFGVDADIPWGALTAITGANGAGKSTLLEILAGVRKPRAGTVTRAGDVALVVQRATAPELLPLTVRDVVTMGLWGRSGRSLGRHERDELTSAALEQLDLLALLNRPFTSLSGGQRQRTLLAQGLARGCEIFLLDEPATGLDSASRDKTQALLALRAEQGAAVVQVTHDSGAAHQADHVVHLMDGRVARDTGHVPQPVAGGLRRV